MSDFARIIGNEALRHRLADDIRRGAFPHAYIIEGGDGSGKHTLAIEIAAALSCENREKDGEHIPCGVCPACRKILGGKSPDVITVCRENGKAQMGVDVIRGMREDVRVLPNDLDIKVYIIEDAHLMNVQAQNAFLLTLEEPPKFVVFLLLCDTTSSLLETIKSRAPIIRMQPLERSLLSKSLVNCSEEAATLKRLSPNEFEEILTLSGGRMGRAIELLDAELRKPYLEARHLAEDFISELTGRRSGRRSVDLLSRFPSSREDIKVRLSQIELALRDLVLVKKSENVPLCFFCDRERAEELSYKFKTADLLKISEAVDTAKKRLAANSNVRLTMYSLAVSSGLI